MGHNPSRPAKEFLAVEAPTAECLRRTERAGGSIPGGRGMTTGRAATALAGILSAGYATATPGAAVGQSAPAWRDRFDVNKADLLPTGKNAYITMQPGRVL